MGQKILIEDAEDRGFDKCFVIVRIDQRCDERISHDDLSVGVDFQRRNFVSGHEQHAYARRLHGGTGDRHGHIARIGALHNFQMFIILLHFVPEFFYLRARVSIVSDNVMEREYTTAAWRWPLACRTVRPQCGYYGQAGGLSYRVKALYHARRGASIVSE